MTDLSGDKVAALIKKVKYLPTLMKKTKMTQTDETELGGRPNFVTLGTSREQMSSRLYEILENKRDLET